MIHQLKVCFKGNNLFSGATTVDMEGRVKPIKRGFDLNLSLVHIRVNDFIA